MAHGIDHTPDPDAGDHVCTESGVLLDQDAFFLGQFPGLVQDAVRYADLADVMQRRRHAEQVDVLERQTQRYARLERVSFDTPRVASRVGVLGFERGSQLMK